MLTRRRFLERALRGTSLIAAGPMVPGFLAATARAAEPGKESVLVVLEMTGGNDGLNTVVPYADDLYHKARPTLRLTRPQVVRVNDEIGLNPGLRGLEKLLSADQVAILQGIGYPNPDRSHFQSMDVWQTADPSRQAGSGWLGRGLAALPAAPASGKSQVPGIHIGTEALPLALRGSATGVPSIHRGKPFDLDLAPRPASPNDLAYLRGFNGITPEPSPPPGPGDDVRYAARRRLIEDLSELSPARDPLLQFARRTSLETFAAVDHLREVTRTDRRQGARPSFLPANRGNGELSENFHLVANLIAAGFGTRIFYLAVSGFDTHANQLQGHQQLLQQVGDAIAGFFAQLEQSGHAKRVLLLTFSEFGRRVQENGSKGTDHGAASCLFLAGPAVRGGVVGPHPGLAPDQLDSGDLRHHTDFRRVYATLLDAWLGCPSADVLGGTFEHLPLLKQV